jgi:hypothetical protein
MQKKSKNSTEQKYLLLLYRKVADFLSTESVKDEELPDVMVSFCTVIEKILKIKLHKKNPVLIFSASQLKDENSLVAVILKKEKDIETLKIKDILSRFIVVFDNYFTPDEAQALIDIYGVRNFFIHGYKADDKINFISEDIIKKMGTIWEKISFIAISLFGKENIKSSKPRKKYSEQELEAVLEEEVRKMIARPLSLGYSYSLPLTTDVETFGYGRTTLRCPRCGTNNFSQDSQGETLDRNFSIQSTFFSKYPLSYLNSGLYKCTNCNLELTEKQYEIAKKISLSL